MVTINKHKSLCVKNIAVSTINVRDVHGITRVVSSNISGILKAYQQMKNIIILFVSMATQ
jgi:hypothetical protein